MTAKTNSTINGVDYYRIRRTIGYKEVDGKRVPIIKNFYGTSARDAQRQYDDYRARHSERPAILLSELAEEYTYRVLAVNSNYAEQTIDRYTRIYEMYVADSVLMDKYVSDLTVMDIQRFYNSLTVSDNVIRAINKYMSGLFKWLMRQNMCANLLTAVVLPKKPAQKSEPTVWTEEEVQRILDCSVDHSLRFLIILALFTGARISELLALTYADLENDEVRINKQLINGKPAPTKCNSDRIVPMNNIVKAEYEIHKIKYPGKLVFTTESGKPLDRANVRRSLDRLYARNNIEHKKFHAYRATFGTNLCKAGVPIQVASNLLGHKSVEVTAKYYVKIDKSEKQIAVDALNSNVLANI